MDTYHVVLYIHLLSLLVAVGAASVLLACLVQLRAARTLEQAVPWAVVAGKVAHVFPLAVVGLFGTGAYMTSHFWTWGTGWIDLGIAALVLLLAQGAGIAGPAGKKLEEALRANGPGPLGAEARRSAVHPALWVVELSNLGLVFGVVWNMTEKPGFGGALAAVLVGYAVGAALGLLATRSSPEELAAAPESAG